MIKDERNTEALGKAYLTRLFGGESKRYTKGDKVNSNGTFYGAGGGFRGCNGFRGGMGGQQGGGFTVGIDGARPDYRSAFNRDMGQPSGGFRWAGGFDKTGCKCGGQSGQECQNIGHMTNKLWDEAPFNDDYYEGSTEEYNMFGDASHYGETYGLYGADDEDDDEEDDEKITNSTVVAALGIGAVAAMAVIGIIAVVSKIVKKN